MYPTLFNIFGLRIDSYSVAWFIALSLAIILAIKRLEIYKVNEDVARNVMSISFLLMLFGAKSPEYITNWEMYFHNPSFFITKFNQGGIHEFGAIGGAFFSAFILCMLNRKKISFLKLAEAASPCVLLAIAVGRWGCFLNGCCVGSISDSFCAVHFPNDPAGLTRHPVQIYYSIFAFVCFLIILIIEKIISRSHDISKSHSILTPLTIMFYTIMRFSMIPFREAKPFFYLIENFVIYRFLFYALIFEFLWLLYGLLKLKSVKNR